MAIRPKHVLAAFLSLLVAALYYPSFMASRGYVDFWHPASLLHLGRARREPPRAAATPPPQRRVQRFFHEGRESVLDWRESGEIERLVARSHPENYEVEWSKEGYKVFESGRPPSSFPPEVDAVERIPGPDPRALEAIGAHIAAVVGARYARENYLYRPEGFSLSDDRKFGTPRPRRTLHTHWAYLPAARLAPSSVLELELSYSVAPGAGAGLPDAKFAGKFAALAKGAVVEPKLTSSDAIKAAMSRSDVLAMIARLGLENVSPETSLQLEEAGPGTPMHWYWGISVARDLVQAERGEEHGLSVLVDASSGRVSEPIDLGELGELR